MRRVSRAPDQDDRGAVLVWVATSLVMLLGMGAIVIDVGALYQERRELQNGADAAALAVAKDCALGDCLDEDATADHYADENANDDASNVPQVCGQGPGLVACPDPPPAADGASGWVRVDTSTHNPANPDNDGEIEFVLAPVLDAANVGETVEATAIAAWGSVGSATTIPLIFSVCEFNEFGGSLSDGAPLPTGTHYIYFHNTTEAGTCPAGPSGADLPGGFGWLQEDGDCEIDIDADGWVDDKTGNSLPQGCDPTEWQDAEVLLPLYDRTNGLTGSNGEYHVVGFVGFRVLGYHFNGNNRWNVNRCPNTQGNQAVCLLGEFTRVTTEGGIGGGPDYGARVVEMIG
jgi:Putative Flp pilus-assembly TadE/G-like